MVYYSLNGQSPEADFRTATINGQAPDKGLYFPVQIPKISRELLENIRGYSDAAIAYEVIAPYTGDTIPATVLKNIAEETVHFDIPLVPITDRIYSLELFHGPTLAFKDTGARFMSRCLGYFARTIKNRIVVLVATSGDTGGAVANGFYGVEGVDVVILYPSGKVSSVQEKQLTTLGGNITALEVNGNFDDCQRMVKEAFMDAAIRQRLLLTSANSINVARWLPQQFYYFFLWKQWEDKQHPPVVAVPSGNFGNICAGLLAAVSGLPLKQFLAACNANDVVPRFLETGVYEPTSAIATISNAMDVGDPSNFVRILELFGKQAGNLRQLLKAGTVSDEQTRQTLLDVFQQQGYLLDTHGAVAFTVLAGYLGQQPGQRGVLLETAHPVKFYDVIEPLIGQAIPLPEVVAGQMQKKKQSILMEPSLEALKEFLMHF
ncbi:MAG: threonine synthase [Ferruginibacter sp.]